MPKPKFLMDQLKMLLSTGIGADVHFSVGEGDRTELLSAHKSLLIGASDVFEAMFPFDEQNGKTGNSPSNPVVVSDVDVSAFKAMLRFIYTNSLSELNGDNAMAVLYAAKKYGIIGLIEASVDFPVSKLPNVFLAFTQSSFLGEDQLARRCLAYIDCNAEVLLESDDFLAIGQELLCELLGRDELMVEDEGAVWRAALRWADKQCGKKGMECSGENRRAMLGSALYKIRIPLMSKEEFEENILPTHVLSDNELIAVLMCICHFQPKELYPLQFSTQRRASVLLRPNGMIFLCIDNLSKLSHLTDERRRRPTSKDFYISGLSWRIYADNGGYNRKHCLNFFLQCNGTGNAYDSWSCVCSATLRIVAQREGKADYVHVTKHFTFCPAVTSCLLSCIQPFDVLMDSNNGWYDVKEDKLKVVVDLVVKEDKEQQQKQQQIGVNGEQKKGGAEQCSKALTNEMDGRDG